ncbi:MAG: hypothetical protein PHT03_05795 [Bacilli bacterium]|nr:hypothetical protein [Bacilli bacterium]MDD4389111.1 hypothetical protein [Bacilli bacterium]
MVGLLLGCGLGVIYCIYLVRKLGQFIIPIDAMTIIKPLSVTVSAVSLGSLVPSFYASRINIIYCLKVD